MAGPLTLGPTVSFVASIRLALYVRPLTPITVSAQESIASTHRAHHSPCCGCQGQGEDHSQQQQAGLAGYGCLHADGAAGEQAMEQTCLQQHSTACQYPAAAAQPAL
jgi:hypothetical protein